MIPLRILLLVLISIGPITQCKAQERITYGSFLGITYDGQNNSITKTASVGWGNAGAISSNCLRGALDGVVSIQNVSSSGHVAIGLSRSASGYDLSSMDFGMSFDNGTLKLYESGAAVYNHGSFSTSDDFEMIRSSGVISVKVNGTTAYTSGVTINTDMIVDLALFDVGASISDVIVDFKRCDPTTGDQYGSVQRVLDDTYYFTHGGVLKVRFVEEYFAGVDTKLSYTLYDSDMSVIASVDYDGNPTSGAPNPIVY
ncbi:MAG: hypothetical protein RIF46_01385 [Cyclobacteriaceae bacterium]